MLSLGQLRQVTDRFKSDRSFEGEAAADLQTTLAAAYAALGSTEQASAKLQPVLQQFPSHVPSHVPALLLQARLFAARGDIATALSKVDALLAHAPDNPPCLATARRFAGATTQPGSGRLGGLPP